ncbi:LuxR C-terminal-related transcriptional regulator [Nonomuraea gerenzanensis]|uniref:Regulatory protein n=1 Tax=Nonomuraea gerenzanensis TaxID=93944 RepID=A0A1M4EAW6_9ACTN|nr:LuxR C-terminal-related transcriptional regulator [Nonomuraea gerenzanensis]UBU18065.1 LuxR C-terminal-related transcriptional regulator [Nonomuraea gerenzanensis]SBO95872.1 regulatory protein [Nonomuraea gerenzanensis]
MDLSVIGITPQAEQVYRFFLKHKGEGVGSVPEALGMDPDTVEEAVDLLGRLSMLDLTDRYRVTATDPRVAIERLVEQRMEELNAEIRRVFSARDAISSFQDDKREGDKVAAILDIERVEDGARVRQRLDDLAFFCYKETLCLHPGGPFTEVMIESALPLDQRSLRRGLALKQIFHPKAIEDQRMLSYLRELVNLGAEIRITDQHMDRMLMYDRSVAVVPIDPSHHSAGALLVREPGLISQLYIYFEGLWKSAVDLRHHLDPPDEEPALSQMEQRILTVMATADKDEIAARELDISVRTYRRYVADLMARLGAANRFQAALRAKEENWI